MTNFGRISKVRSFTEKERDELRAKILRFCSKPRTQQEVAKKFGISGISASAFLSNLINTGKVESDGTLEKQECGTPIQYIRCWKKEITKGLARVKAER